VFESNVASFQIFLLFGHCCNFRQEPVGDVYVLDISIDTHMNGGKGGRGGITTQNWTHTIKDGELYKVEAV
jgi:hypothetical protein